MLITPPPIYTHEIIFDEFDFSALTHTFILANSSNMPDSGSSDFFTVNPSMISVNVGCFEKNGGSLLFPNVMVQYLNGALKLSCSCNYKGNNLCDFQVQVLYNIMERQDLRIYFDAMFRHSKINEVAIHYGLQNLPDPDAHFELNWSNRSVSITPKIKNLLAVNEHAIKQLFGEIMPHNYLPEFIKKNDQLLRVLIFSEHKYYKHLQVGLYDAETGIGGKIKNPVTAVDPLSLAWKTSAVAEVKFYTGIASLQHQLHKTTVDTDLKALKAVVNNPLLLPVYYHNPDVSQNITALSLVPVKLSLLQIELELLVYLKNDFYEINGQLKIAEKTYPLNMLPLKYGQFILADKTLHLIESADLLSVATFFKKHNNTVLIHRSKFDVFKQTVLAKLADKILIKYAWHVPATQEQLEEYYFNGTVQKLIYLTDAGLHVMINPVMRYGEAEVNVLSKLQLYATDQKGVQFVVERNDVAENNMIAMLLKQHPDFEAQIYQQAFYLTKKQFLNEDWFLDVFEEWIANDIKILGFNEIKNNKLNANKGKVTVKVTSGLDWFNTDLDVRYGKQKASLLQLRKTLKNNSKYVQLDDGTLGLLPAEWVSKMAAYFELGEIIKDEIRTPLIQFSAIANLYQPIMLSVEVLQKLDTLNNKFANFKLIKKVAVSNALKAVLRPYQQQGLNWLNFLDDFNFGGCLADDMGLGKTIQIIAFILLLQKKHGAHTNLVIVPTSLIFNWQQELEKFAPSLNVLIIKADNRIKNNHSFSKYDVVLTTYGMMISNIHFLKTFYFKYIFLDESQAIKNPDSLRYKTARLLQSKNKIVLTGTPIENNTFDLYGQLSFACPGLLGTQQHFKDIYSQPIDKFGDSKRAAELQQKINPFILRRTKKQVATELPEKTEMIIYCEMGMEQRKVYDAYEKEFRNYLLHKPAEDLPRESMHVLQGLTKLRQICNSPSLLKDESFYGDAAAKIRVLVEQIESKSKQHKILVFSQFVGMLDLIKKELATKYIAYEYLTGKTKDREAVVTNFQNNENIRVFLISLKAGGTGLNLTEADYVYLVDPWWNPAVENQAIDRCYRIGQHKNVVAIRLICPDTIEEKIVKLQAAKKELVNDLIKTDLSTLKRLSKEDLLQLVSPDAIPED